MWALCAKRITWPYGTMCQTLLSYQKTQSTSTDEVHFWTSTWLLCLLAFTRCQTYHLTLWCHGSNFIELRITSPDEVYFYVSTFCHAIWPWYLGILCQSNHLTLWHDGLNLSYEKSRFTWADSTFLSCWLTLKLVQSMINMWLFHMISWATLFWNFLGVIKMKVREPRYYKTHYWIHFFSILPLQNSFCANKNYKCR